MKSPRNGVFLICTPEAIPYNAALSKKHQRLYKKALEIWLNHPNIHTISAQYVI